MAEIQTHEIAALIVKEVAALAPQSLSADSHIENHQSLLEYIDSFGFVNLLMSLEDNLGIELDIAADLSTLVQFQDLIVFIQSRVENGAALCQRIV